VFTVDKVSVAEPDFVNESDDPPDTAPEISAAAAAFTVAPPEPIATVPDNLPLATENFTAPADERPAPTMVNGSATVTAAPTSNVAPDDTEVAPAVVPKPVAFSTTIVPYAIEVIPV